MSISTRQRMIATSHGSLAVEESGQGGIPVLLIHGNSLCRGVFRNQMQGQIAKNRRLIAFDLPGHGQSSNASDPERSYTRPGLADAAVELLDKLGVTEAIVFGWSLGGHIGIEMIPRFPGMRGLMISGAPPVSHNQMSKGFNASPHLGVAGKQEFVESIFGESAEAFLRHAVERADGRFRKILFEAARAGVGVDQRQIVESSPVPLAVLNGGGSLRQSRILRYRRLCQFVGSPLSSPERVGARPFLGSARRFRSGSRTVPARCRNWPYGAQT
jgi:pimeloyl-ACP methyl ester carboxylesterase